MTERNNIPESFGSARVRRVLDDVAHQHNLQDLLADSLNYPFLRKLEDEQRELLLQDIEDLCAEYLSNVKPYWTPTEASHFRAVNEVLEQVDDELVKRLRYLSQQSWFVDEFTRQWFASERAQPQGPSDFQLSGEVHPAELLLWLPDTLVTLRASLPAKALKQRTKPQNEAADELVRQIQTLLQHYTLEINKQLLVSFCENVLEAIAVKNARNYVARALKIETDQQENGQ